MLRSPAMRGLGLGVIVAATLVAACACKQKSTGGGTGPGGDGGGTGSGSNVGSGTGDPAACDGVAGKVEGLYQASAERTKLTPEEIKDNTAMVMAECKGAPDRVIAATALLAGVPLVTKDVSIAASGLVKTIW